MGSWMATLRGHGNSPQVGQEVKSPQAELRQVAQLASAAEAAPVMMQLESSAVAMETEPACNGVGELEWRSGRIC